MEKLLIYVEDFYLSMIFISPAPPLSCLGASSEIKFSLAFPRKISSHISWWKRDGTTFGRSRERFLFALHY